MLFYQYGKPNTDWKNDTVGQPVNPAIKLFQTIGLKVAKMVRSNVDIDTGNENLNTAGKIGAQVAEDQIAADPHATPQDRLKKAGASVATGVQENVDNDAVKIAAGVAKVSIHVVQVMLTCSSIGVHLFYLHSHHNYNFYTLVFFFLPPNSPSPSFPSFE